MPTSSTSPTSPRPHVFTQHLWCNPISLLVLSALSDHLQKLMQCIYILDTPYLFEVTYVIYLDTIVCHLCNAFFLFLSLFFFVRFYLLIQMVPSAVYIYYIFTIYSKHRGGGEGEKSNMILFFLNKRKLGCDAVTYSR